jgi:hypothetical protein
MGVCALWVVTAIKMIPPTKMAMPKAPIPYPIPEYAYSKHSPKTGAVQIVVIKNPTAATGTPTNIKAIPAALDVPLPSVTTSVGRLKREGCPPVRAGLTGKTAPR